MLRPNEAMSMKAVDLLVHRGAQSGVVRRMGDVSEEVTAEKFQRRLVAAVKATQNLDYSKTGNCVTQSYWT